MNNKLLLAVVTATALNVSGCSILTSMLTTEDEYKANAAQAIGVAEDDLKVIPESIQAGLNATTVRLKGSDGSEYRCSLRSSVSGAVTSTKCKKKEDKKWVDIGTEVKSDDYDEESDMFSGITFTIGGGEGINSADPAVREKARQEMLENNKKRKKSQAKSTPTTEDYAPAASSSTYVEKAPETRAVPTVVIEPGESEDNAYRTNPTKTYNGKFKVRDEQGHSYECHFANVGQVVSDTISVCTKLY